MSPNEHDPSGWPETTRPTGQHYTVAALTHFDMQRHICLRCLSQLATAPRTDIFLSDLSEPSCSAFLVLGLWRNLIADASRMTITNPESLSHSACACWLQDGLGPPQASRQARLWGVLLSACAFNAPFNALQHCLSKPPCLRLVGPLNGHS